MRNAFEYLLISAGKRPEKTAFSDGAGEISFKELLRRALAVGTALTDMGCRRGGPVAVLCERSVDAVCAFMGVLAAGCFYVPLDRKMPPKRLEGILTRLSPEAVLCETAEDIREAARRTALTPELYGHGIQEEELAARRERVLDVDPAYMLFTSGSTGEPKGIVVSHRGLIDLAEWLTEAGDFSEADILGNQAPFYFDGSVKDLYITIKCAATCHILPLRLFMFPKLLVGELNRLGVSAVAWATSAFHLLAASGVFQKYTPQFIRKVLAGGESMLAVDLNAWRRALPEARFINLYGPTEATVDSAYYVIDRDFADGEAVPIGRPCANKEILLLDDEMRPVPDGQVGEIYIRGAGLALGYFGDWEKTGRAFIQNPLNRLWLDPVYRTGDLARVGEDGLLYFSNRADGQIKHLGYRIELGEIESALSAVEGVRAAVCFFDREADWIVCAYEGEGTPESITRSLRNLVPRYMMPNIFRKYSSMPRNRNGKLDRPRIRREYEDDKADKL